MRASTTTRTLGATLLAAAAIAWSGTAAAADPMTPPQWAASPLIPASQAPGGVLATTAPVLGVRTPKPSGGYSLNPFCMTSDGSVMIGSVTADGAGFRVKCGGGGQVITNPQDFQEESKSIIQQRGGLSAKTAYYTKAGTSPTTTYNYVLCYGRAANGLTIPGYMSVPQPGTVPAGCSVKVMGASTVLTDYGVIVHKGDPGIPNDNGWWTPGAISPQTVQLPLFVHVEHDNGRQIFCRGRRPNQTQSFPGRLLSSSSGYKCHVITFNLAFEVVTDFDLYVEHRAAGQVGMSRVDMGDSLPWGSALVINDSATASARLYRCQQQGGAPGTPASGKWGYATAASPKLCKVVGSNDPEAEKRFSVLTK